MEEENNVVNKIWEDALSRLRGRLEKSSYLPIKNIVPVSKTDNFLNLGITDDFYLECLIKPILPIIEQAVSEANNGRGLSLKFEVDPKYIQQTQDNTKEDSPVIPQYREGTLLQGSVLSPMNTMDSFVVGDNNKFAYAAAKEIISNLNTLYSKQPLYLYGETALGKTHLIQAIANQALKFGKSVACYTTEQFLNEYSDSLNNFSSNAFRKKSRGVDTLVLDEFGFLKGKKKVQEEVFNLLNSLLDSGKQIVAASNLSPRGYDFEENLISRFEKGLVLELLKPDMGSRIEFLKRRFDSKVDNPKITFLAKNIRSNYNKLLGAYETVSKYENWLEKIPDEKMEEKLRGIVRHLIEDSSKAGLNEIIQFVCSQDQVNIDCLSAGVRSNKDVTRTKHAIWYLARLADYSLQEIGKATNRDHTTVLAGCANLEKRMAENPQVYDGVCDLAKKLNLDYTKIKR